MRSVSRWARVAAVTALVGLAAGCAATPGPSATPDPARTSAAAPAPSLTPLALDPLAVATAHVRTLPVRAKAASILMVTLPTNDPAALHAFMAGTGIGGFILMGSNVPASEGELRAVTAALAADPQLPPLVAVDEEGGDVARLPWDDLPSARTLKGDPPEATRDAFAARAAMLQRAGITVNFGIVSDVTADPGMFIHDRALGTTPDAAAARTAAAVEGERGTVASTLKHFPGHGAAPGDSHAGIPEKGMSEADWAARDAVPFAAGVDAGAQLLMFGHLVYSAVDAAPASLSAPWHRIARDRLGFDGVAITDDIGMLESSGRPEYTDPVANAVAAVAAGNDMVLDVVGADAGSADRLADGIAAAVETGRLDPARLDEAAARVLALRIRLAGVAETVG